VAEPRAEACGLSRGHDRFGRSPLLRLTPRDGGQERYLIWPSGCILVRKSFLPDWLVRCRPEAQQERLPREGTRVSNLLGSASTGICVYNQSVASPDLSKPDLSPDPIIERYKVDVDRTLIRENLRKTHEERLLALQGMQAFVDEVRAAGKAARRTR